MSIETFKKQLMECKLKDLTPEAFDVLFRYAFGSLSQPKPLIAAESPYGMHVDDMADAVAVAAFQVRPPSKPPTKNARALAALSNHPKGLTAAELADYLSEEVRLIYPLLSNLKREGKVRWKDGVYFLGSKK